MAQRRVPFRCTEAVWDDMVAGNAAEYGYSQELVDAFAEKMEQCAAFWAKKRANANITKASKIKPAKTMQGV